MRLPVNAISVLRRYRKFFNKGRQIKRKGYDFDVLNGLDDADYIRQGNHPSRSKSVYITESGKELAKELLSKYGIDDWK